LRNQTFNANPFPLQPMNVALRSINSESEGRMLEKKNSKVGLRLRSSLGMASREAFAS